MQHLRKFRKSMIQRKKGNLTTVSLAAIISAGTMGFFWNVHTDSPFLNYSDVQTLLNYELPNRCRVQSVTASTGDPVVEIHLSDKSIRKLRVPDDKSDEFFTRLFKRGITINLLCR